MSAVEGTVTPAQDRPTTSALPSPSRFAWLSSVLPTSTELSDVLGHYVSPYGTLPPVGDIGDLRSTIIVSGDVKELQCLGVVSPFEKQAFSAAPVQAVNYGMVSGVTIGAVALASTEDARSLYATFADQWMRCEGKSLVNQSGNTTLTRQITQVTATDTLVSAVVLISSDSPTGVPVRSERALGVSQDCIVEASVPITDPLPTQDRQNNAIAVVRLMMEKVVDARR